MQLQFFEETENLCIGIVFGSSAAALAQSLF